MYYRFYIPSDFDALYAIEEICYEPPLRFERDYMQELLDKADSAAWICEHDATMVGFGVAEWGLDGKKGDKDRKMVGYVHTVEVLPEYRGHGIGLELMRRLEETVRESDAESMWLHVDELNADAIRLYSERGFKYEKRVADYYGPERAALVYRKLLGAGASAEGVGNETPL